LAGRIDPGSGAGVATGHRVSFIPARIADTNARLSFLLRPGTAGTVIGGAFAVSGDFDTESGLILLNASPAVTTTGSSLGSLSTEGAGFASLTAQPARETTGRRQAKIFKRIFIIET
jgi:hypothetical protein